MAGSGVRAESEAAALAFQVFKRNRITGDGPSHVHDTIDLTGADEVVVDLLGRDAPGPHRFATPRYAPFPGPTTGPTPGPTPGSEGAGGRPFSGSSTSDEAERISAWADRMRQKRARDRAAILGDSGPRASTAGYWSSDHLGVGDDPTLDPGVVADPSRRSRLLGELGLTPDATTDDVAGAYRRLAKQHHPDRWAEADEATRALNAEEMMRINAVYRALRINGDVGPRGRASTPPAPPAPGPR